MELNNSSGCDYLNGSNVSIICEVVNEHTVLCAGEEYKSEEILKPSNGYFWLYLCLYMLMVIFAGM